MNKLCTFLSKFRCKSIDICNFFKETKKNNVATDTIISVIAHI
jgi:hypothetical protein